jgi:hypothetical protein
MNLDVHSLVVASERRLLPTQTERARLTAEAGPSPRRQGPGAPRRAGGAGGARLARLGARLRWGAERDRALGAPAAS